MKTKYLVGTVLAIGVAITAVVMAVGSQSSYVDFNSATDSGERVQIKGQWVKEEGFKYDAAADLFHFTLKDESGKSMAVTYEGAKPDNFELAEEVVVGGTVDGDRFLATHILTKCPSKYEADGEGMMKSAHDYE